MTPTNKKRILILSMLLFIAALFSPTLEEFDLRDRHPDVLPGYLVFVWGWYLLPFLHPAWFANVTWIISIILFFKNRRKGFIYFSIASFLFSLDSFLYPSERYLGFYLWNIAVNIPLLINLSALVVHKLKPVGERP